MKKYWPVLSLIVVSIIGLSFYYSNMTKAFSSNVDLQFETLQGDDKYLEPLSIEMNYYGEYKTLDYFFENGEATRLTHGFNYFDSDYSLLQEINAHKNFFRAKRLMGRHYYSDEQSLVYVVTDDQYHYDHRDEILYQVDRLHKKTGERDTMDITLNVTDDYAWQTVEWVHNKDNELQTLSIRQDHGEESVILTTFDLQKKTAVEKVLVKSSEMGQFSFQHYDMSYNTNDIAVFSQYTYKDREGNQAPEETLYMYTNGELTELELPVNKSNHFIQVDVTNTDIVVAMTADEQINIQRYNLNSKKWEQTFSVETELAFSEGTPKIQYLNDLFYVSYAVDQGYVLEILDGLTEQKKYVGLLTAQMGRHDQLYIKRIHITN